MEEQEFDYIKIRYIPQFDKFKQRLKNNTICRDDYEQIAKCIHALWSMTGICNLDETLGYMIRSDCIKNVDDTIIKDCIIEMIKICNELPEEDFFRRARVLGKPKNKQS
jgi:hypothetical protein